MRSHPRPQANDENRNLGRPYVGLANSPSAAVPRSDGVCSTASGEVSTPQPVSVPTPIEIPSSSEANDADRGFGTETATPEEYAQWENRMVQEVGMMVFADKRDQSWPKYENPFTRNAPEYLPASEALTRRFSTDAHFVAYFSAEHSGRLSIAGPLHDNDDRRGAHERLSRGVLMLFMVFDVDDPAAHKTGEPASETWRKQERTKILTLFVAHPGGFAYWTRGGYRILYRLAAPFRITSNADYMSWRRRYLAECSYLANSCDIKADHGCADWTRYFRLPYVVREAARGSEQKK